MAWVDLAANQGVSFDSLRSAVTTGEDGMLSLSYREVTVAKIYALEKLVKELEEKYGV